MLPNGARFRKYPEKMKFVVSLILICAVTGPVWAQVSRPAAGEDRPLDVLTEEYPVAFFFRQTEGLAAVGKLPYPAWQARFSGLMGVMGKMLDEEVPGRHAAQGYYRQFKKEHPSQAVLLHLSMSFRDRMADQSAFCAGHWLYFNGARVLSNLPAASGSATLRVSDTTLFEMSPFFNNRALADDIGLCELDEHGKPDWHSAEQVRLEGIDRKAGTITVQRGQFGTTPRAFAAGKAYAAAHVAWNWAAASPLWQLNLASTCPRDRRGRNAAEAWADLLIAAMRPGGALDYVDGFEFDVPARVPMIQRRTRQADCDADGQPDDGVVDGQQVFAIGTDEFARQLRKSLPGKLMMADAGEPYEQRSPNLYNGVETEGWPHLKDTNFVYWSAGLNRQAFWRSRACAPVLTYGLIKFENTNMPLATVRLTLAGPLLAGAAVGQFYSPLKNMSGIWDELVGGTLAKRAWLGRALGPARHLAVETPDLLQGAGNPPAASLTAMISSEGSQIAVQESRLVAAGKASANGRLTLRLSGLKLPAASDLVVQATATAEAPENFPAGSYRELAIAAVAPGEVPKERTAHAATPLDQAPFTAEFYQRHVPAGVFDLVLSADGAAPLRLAKLTLHAAADLVVREFEHGIILANPSHSAQEFNLEKLFPTGKFRRLQATAGQDASVNNGEPVGRTVTLGPGDALFLLRAN